MLVGLRPVLYDKVRDATELSLVIRHQHRAEFERLPRDEDIVGSDWRHLLQRLAESRPWEAICVYTVSIYPRIDSSILLNVTPLRGTFRRTSESSNAVLVPA